MHYLRKAGKISKPFIYRTFLLIIASDKGTLWTMDYCPGHPGYDEDFRGNCKFCGHPRKPSLKASPFGDYVDPFALARGLQAREEQKKREWIPEVNNCPYCKIKTLFYNKFRNTFECLNIECTKYHVQIEYTSAEYSFIITYIHSGSD